MSDLESLVFRLDQLAYEVERRNTAHQRRVAALREDAAELRRRIHRINDQRQEVVLSHEQDTTLMRRVEWRISDASSTVMAMEKNKAIWSQEFCIMGTPMQLEFLPGGRDSTWMPGFCALFLWCPAGVKIRYQLRIGNHRTAPDHDEYVSKMGHGHSNFCFLEAQRDPKEDSLIVGVDILDMSLTREYGSGLKIINQGPEACIRREALALSQRGVARVEWRITDVARRVREVPCGSAISTSPFSLSGVREIFMEFYPNGILNGANTPGNNPNAGYCGFYVRCTAGSSLVLTLFVGSVKKGPTKTEFDGTGAKGLPKFCKLQDMIDDNGDVVVGVVIENPALQEEAQSREIRL